MSRTLIDINPEIKEKLQEEKIRPYDDALCYLMCLYYNIKPTYIPENLINKILATGIINRDYITGEITWKINFLSEDISNFEWINEYRNLFKSINPERVGVKNQCISRMKRFFINNPSIRKDDIIEATKNYIRQVDNPKYLKSADYFIYYDGENSLLKEYIERLPKKVINEQSYSNFI